MLEGMTSYAPAEASERTGLSLDTLRYYEHLGLFGPVGRTAGGRRIYTERDVARVRLRSTFWTKSSPTTARTVPGRRTRRTLVRRDPHRTT
jgi:hypothetical protein